MIKKRKLSRTKLQQNTRHVPRVISREVLCCNEANKDVKINIFGKYNDESFLDKIIYQQLSVGFGIDKMRDHMPTSVAFSCLFYLVESILSNAVAYIIM